MAQKECSNNEHTPELVKKLNIWEDSFNETKGYTAIYQCAVCGFRWSEEVWLKLVFNSWSKAWVWAEL